MMGAAALLDMLKRFVPFCVFAMMVLCALWAPRQASGIIVHVQVHWSGQLSDYNIGADSIIQIIVYNKAYDPPGSTVEDNFDRGRSGAYLLSSTPEGHEIIYEEALKETDRWFDIDVPYVVKNQYYTYVRIISREDDQDREYYWGITKPSKVNGTYNIHNSRWSTTTSSCPVNSRSFPSRRLLR